NLRSAAGERLLTAAAALVEDPFAAVKLRGVLSPELTAAAVDQVRLRRRAAGRFAAADRMWFTATLLEQASGDIASAYHAQRFAGVSAAGDFCCGLGADASALARAAPAVFAVDRDALAVALTAANAEALGCGDQVRVLQAEVPADAPHVRAAWVDPGRRE